MQAVFCLMFVGIAALAARAARHEETLAGKIQGWGLAAGALLMSVEMTGVMW